MSGGRAPSTVLSFSVSMDLCVICVWMCFLMPVCGGQGGSEDSICV